MWNICLFLPFEQKHYSSQLFKRFSFSKVSPKQDNKMKQQDSFKLTLFLLLIGLGMMVTIVHSDMMRKSIVFDPKTPKVFYCPQEKPVDMNKMIVKAIPLERLCEYEGQNNIPKGAKSDCYADVDESEYACAEKQRIELRINPPVDTSETTTIIPTPDAPEHIKVNSKEQMNKKKSTKFNGKKV